MKRDLVCLARLAVDSMPLKIRNSRILFGIAQKLFQLPQSLYFFRTQYKAGKIQDLSVLYQPGSPYFIQRASGSTDVNSYHLADIVRLINHIKPASILDVGCGTGYLLEHLRLRCKSIRNFHGIDFSVDRTSIHSEISFEQGDICEILERVEAHSFDAVLCTHVIEHINHPELLLPKLKRVSRNAIVVICPLEKEFRWGMNYHVNFYPSRKEFVGFIRSCIHGNVAEYVSERLGDCMYASMT